MRRFVEQIGAEALRAGEVIRRLRDLVRKDGGRPVAADLDHLVRESVRLIDLKRARGWSWHRRCRRFRATTSRSSRCC